MHTTIGLMRFTEQGLNDIKNTTRRAAAARETAQQFGVKLRELYWTVGEYDLVCVLEAEDEYALAAFTLATARQGNITTRSLRAYSAAEMDQVLAKLP